MLSEIPFWGSIEMLGLTILRLYRVAQKGVHFSTHHIFGIVQAKIKTDFIKMFLELLGTK